ncbi:hypothetical protein [Henriciella sp.]|uniref:hypothetical protein n=1 Tax=Henriciella sp. TaxID=1968823 RepID=UPI002617EF60|nr:hypothetical protein [Henriciella sp.]
MKRTLLTATTAIAFAAMPATAQLVGGDAGVTTDTDIATDIGETAAETGTQVRSDIRTGVENNADAAAEWESDADVNAGVNANARVDGNYENEQDTAAGARLDTRTDVNTGATLNRGADTGASLAGEANTGLDARAVQQSAEGGAYTESRADATAQYRDRTTMANGDVSARVDSLDTEELNAYAAGQVRKATGDASVGASSSLETEAETRY